METRVRLGYRESEGPLGSQGLVFLGSRERRVIRGCQGAQELQALQDPKVKLGKVLAHLGHKVFLDLEGTWEGLAGKVIKVLEGTLECQVSLDRRVTQASKELDYLASQALKVFLEYRVHLGYLEHQEQLGRMVSPEKLAHRGKRGNQAGVFLGPRGPWGLRGSLGSQERRAVLGYLASQDVRDRQGRLGLRESKVIQDPQGCMGLRGHLAPQDQASQDHLGPRAKQAYLAPLETWE